MTDNKPIVACERKKTTVSMAISIGDNERRISYIENRKDFLTRFCITLEICSYHQGNTMQKRSFAFIMRFSKNNICIIICDYTVDKFSSDYVR